MFTVLLLVRLLVKGRLTVAKFWGSEKLYMVVNHSGRGEDAGIPNPHIIQGSTVYTMLCTNYILEIYPEYMWENTEISKLP